MNRSWLRSSLSIGTARRDRQPTRSIRELALANYATMSGPMPGAAARSKTLPPWDKLTLAKNDDSLLSAAGGARPPDFQRGLKLFRRTVKAAQ